MARDSRALWNCATALRTVTFLFTDVEGSTVLWDRHPGAMRDALVEHDRLIRQAVDSHHGYVFSTAGDSFAVAFERVRDALDTALELGLRKITGEVTLRVRAGIHTGETTVRDGDYFGASLNRMEQAGERTAISAHHAAHFADLAALLQRRQRSERRRTTQPTFVLADLEDLRRHLAGRLDDEELERCLRAGARRTRTELIDIATAALHVFIGSDDGRPLASATSA
jgi:class 3 adenylate cyclase